MIMRYRGASTQGTFRQRHSLSIVLAAILIASVIGALVPTRTVKLLMLVTCGLLAGYGLYRLL